MTQKSIGFRVRFPHFGLFLVIAIAIAIPLTVWSLNNVSTQTQQDAATYTCTKYAKQFCSPEPCDSQTETTGTGTCQSRYKCCKPKPIQKCGSDQSTYCVKNTGKANDCLENASSYYKCATGYKCCNTLSGDW